MLSRRPDGELPLLGLLQYKGPFSDKARKGTIETNPQGRPVKRPKDPSCCSWPAKRSRTYKGPTSQKFNTHQVLKTPSHHHVNNRIHWPIVAAEIISCERLVASSMHCNSLILWCRSGPKLLCRLAFSLFALGFVS